MNWDTSQLTALVRAALDEDLGLTASDHRRGSSDLTSVSIVPASESARARILARQEMVVAGLPLAERVFRELDPAIRFHAEFEEGADVSAGAVLAELKGRARAILTGERTALNLLGRLCGIAGETRRFVEAIAGTRARIRDTRKTTPLLRALEKYAVRAGGGCNHRFGLYDAILIKENHITVAGSVAEALRRARNAPAGSQVPESGEPPEPREMTAYESFQPPNSPAAPSIQVEVRHEKELREALAAGAEAVLLDNVSPGEVARLVRLVQSLAAMCVVEVSGGVTLANVRDYAESGCDFIAIGALTHSAPAADLSLLIETRP